MKKLFIAAALLLICALTIISCSEPATTPATTTPETTTPATTTPATTTPATTTPATTTETPKYGGILKVMLDMTPAGCIGWPPDMITTSNDAGQLCIESLLREMSDGECVPWLASSYEVAPDKSSVTFTLRQNVRFHDGTPFNAEAVRFNWQAMIDANYRGTQYYKSIEVIDEYTIKMNLNSWANYILRSFADSPNMVSPTAYETKGVDWVRWNPVGTGPFKFVSYESDAKLKVTRNDDYWQEGKPYLDGVEIIYVKDPTTQLMAMQSGDGDATRIELGKMASDLIDMGLNVLTQRQSVAIICPDGSNPDSHFADQRVREALEYAIDKEAMADSLGYGLWEAPYQISPRDNVAWDPNPPVVRKYDPDKARQLLAEAGYGDGFDTKIIAALGPTSKDAITAVQYYLEQVGIRAEVEIVEMAKAMTYSTQGWNDSVYISAFGPAANAAYYLNWLLGGTSMHVSIGISDEYKQLLDKACTSVAVEPELIRAAANQLVEEAQVIPLHEGGFCWAMATYVRDAGFLERGSATYWNSESAWLDK